MKNNQNEQKPYNIGLDIGTSSVGWAVTDEKFNIIKKGNKRKPLWGVLLFDEANTAEERRKYRSIRRNYVRRRERIKLLQSIFQDEINKVDQNFFTKLNESFYIEQDKENKTIVLTDIEKEEMKNYQNKYKTIYHLRQALETKQQQFDIRLVYLAIHHIVKYRGNFNYPNFQIDKIDIKPTINNIINLMYEKANNVFIVDYIDNTLLNISELEKLLFSFNIKEMLMVL